MPKLFKKGAEALRLREVEALTGRIMTCYRRTTSELMEIGHCLIGLKQIMPYKEFVSHVESRLGMSSTQAARLMSLYECFEGRTTEAVLSAKPTVLYVLAEAKSKELDQLVKGHELAIDGERKTLSSLTVKDARMLIQRKEQEPPFEFDRELATLCEEAIDEFSFYIVEAGNLKLVPNKPRLHAYVKEVRSCLVQLENILR